MEHGVPQEGMFQACVQHAVPVVLAGSIRDDGPLPDTEMDLIRVKAAYAEALQGGEMRWGEAFSPPAGAAVGAPGAGLSHSSFGDCSDWARPRTRLSDHLLHGQGRINDRLIQISQESVR